MYFAAARKTEAENVLGQNQALTPAEALAMHTKFAAHVTLEEDVKGTLAVLGFLETVKERTLIESQASTNRHELCAFLA